MKVFAKLIGAFGIVSMICALVWIAGWYSIDSVEERLIDVSKTHLMAEMDQLYEMATQLADVRTAEAEATVAKLKVISIVVVLLAIVISMAFGFLIARSTAQPIAMGDKLAEETDVERSIQSGPLQNLIAHFRLQGSQTNSRDSVRQVAVAHLDKSVAKSLNKAHATLPPTAIKNGKPIVRFNLEACAEMDKEFECY